MKIYLKDLRIQLCNAWNAFFQNCDDVEISCGDIVDRKSLKELKPDAIVSPANSFGFMDGGVDMAYSLTFGWAMSEGLQEKIRGMKFGELLVGDATSIRIRDYNPDAEVEWLISAPTMRVPTDVSNTVNAFLAFRAVLHEAKERGFESILCPGLGTAIGKIPPHAAAAQMFAAYKGFKEGINPSFNDLGEAHHLHYWMCMPNHLPEQGLQDVPETNDSL